MSSSNTNQNINPKPCAYNCNIQIYWNTATNEYWEVFTKKKHICPNRSKSVTQTTTTNNNTATTTNKPTYYKKSYYATQTKPKMSNSLELLTGPIETIQKKYEMLSDIVTEYNGKVHGSQRGQDPRTGQLIDLLVYYEVPIGQRDEVKRKFNDFVLSIIPRTN
jgi:hypothetical protein